MTPSEAGRISAERRRERKAEREAAAELDRLTVVSRFSVALARKASYADLEDVVGALVAEAKQGKTQAAALLLKYVEVLKGADDDAPTDALDPEHMTPAQRAAVRADLLALLETPGDEGFGEER